MRRALVRLYPPQWRQRYGAEFDQLLLDRPLAPQDVADVAFSAVDARLRAARGWFGGLGPGPLRTSRVASVAAFGGGLAWILGLVAMGLVTTPEPLLVGFLGLALAGLLLIVAVLALTHLAPLDAQPEAWLAVGVPVIGAAASVLALVGGVMTRTVNGFGEGLWGLMACGALVFIVSSSVFGLVGSRTAILGRRAGRLLAGASVLLTVALLVGQSLGDPVGLVLVLTGWVGFGLAWIVIGLATAARQLPAADTVAPRS